MTTEFESKVAREFEACYELIRELQEQVEALTQTVDDNEQELQSLRTDHSMLEDDVRGIAGEVQDLATDVETLLQDDCA